MSRDKEIVLCPNTCGWVGEDEGPELNPDQHTNCRRPYKCPQCGAIGSAAEFDMKLEDNEQALRNGNEFGQ